jgi:homocysteine S-methyltransferase
MPKPNPDADADAHTATDPLSAPLLLLDGGLGTTLQSPPWNISYFSEQAPYSPLPANHPTAPATTTAPATAPAQLPLWSAHLLLSAPDTLRSVHAAFAGAGADVLMSATYQASFGGFARTDSALKREEVGRAMRAGVGIARDGFDLAWSSFAVADAPDGGQEGEGAGAADVANRSETAAAAGPGQRRQRKRGVVALSLGPYGATLDPGAEYSGLYDPFPAQGLAEWHAQRLAVFSSSDQDECWDEVDIVAFETVPRVDELRAVRRAMALRGRGKRFWVSAVFPGEVESGGRFCLPDGSSVGEVVRAMLGDGDEEMAMPWAIGLNCTKIYKVRRIVLEMEEAVAQGPYPDKEGLRLVLYPDAAGRLVYDTKLGVWVPREEVGVGEEGREIGTKLWAEEMAEIVQEIVARGKWAGLLVGGCCMAGVEEIRGLSERLHST